MTREGADVRLCKEDHTRQKKKSIDAYVRWSRADPGTGTELKSLLTAKKADRAIKNNIMTSGKQLSQQTGVSGGVANGRVLIDARNHQVSAEDALAACRSAVGQANAHGQVLPAQAAIVIDDDTAYVFRPGPLPKAMATGMSDQTKARSSV